MNTTFLLTGLVVPIFSYILQVWPRLKNKYFGIDTWRHLMLADKVRKNKHYPEKVEDRYLITGPTDYPPGIIYLLSIFPKKFLDEYQFIFSPFFDAIHNYFIFLVSLYLTQDLTSAILAQFIAALVPLVVIEASNLSTRVLSYLIFSLSFFPLLLYSYTGNLYFLLAAGLFLFILFFTHKLSIQLYLFTVIGFSLAERSLLYVLFFVGVFILVYIFGGGLYKRILKGHLSILNFWRKHIDLRFAHQFRGLPKRGAAVDFVQRISILALKNPYVYILGNNPWLGIFILFLISNSFDIYSFHSSIQETIFAKLNLWIIFSLISSISILAIKPLRFLGEGQRYVEYSVFPLSLVLGNQLKLLWDNTGAVFIVVLSLVSFFLIAAIVFIQYKTILKDRARTITPDLWNIINYLNEKKGSRVRLAIFPFNMGDAMMYFLKGRVLTTDSSTGLFKLGDIWPFVKLPMKEIVKKYKLNYILFDPQYVTLRELKLKNYKLIKKTENNILIEVGI